RTWLTPIGPATVNVCCCAISVRLNRARDERRFDKPYIKVSRMALLVLTEEQTMLKDSAREFLREQGSVKDLRRLRDEHDANGFSPELWRRMVELGFAGVLVPETAGGSSFGHVGMVQIMEECGRNLTASPLFATGVLG